VHEAVTAAFGPAAAGFLSPDRRPGAVPKGQDRWLLDLSQANSHALREAGVPGDRIHASTIPTGTGAFFSDRAARPCGRLALVASLSRGGAR
jgi:copper oxidase (laccase) domain-containing protein